MQHILLTVIDKNYIIRGFDYITTEDNQYEMRETTEDGFGEIATAIYSQNEYKDFKNIITKLSEEVQSGLVKKLNILRREGVKQWV